MPHICLSRCCFYNEAADAAVNFARLKSIVNLHIEHEYGDIKRYVFYTY